MNPTDLKMLDKYSFIKLDAFSWHLIRCLADVRARRLSAELRQVLAETA